MEIIRCEGLSKIYQAGENKVFALDNVDLTIEQGSFTAITGPSGSGKSTLLHLLSGLDTPSKGRVIYQGKDLYDYKDNQLSVLRRRRFGFVFQSYNLVRELTGWENILLPVMLDGRKADEAYLDQIVICWHPRPSVPSAWCYVRWSAAARIHRPRTGKQACDSVC